MLRIDKEEFKLDIINSLRFFGTTLERATKREIFDAVSKTAMNIGIVNTKTADNPESTNCIAKVCVA